MLTQQLRELEHDAVVTRKVFEVVPPKVEYSLSPYGRTLHPLLEELCAWGNRHERRMAKQTKLAAAGH